MHSLLHLPMKLLSICRLLQRMEMHRTIKQPQAWFDLELRQSLCVLPGDCPRLESTLAQKAMQGQHMSCAGPFRESSPAKQARQHIYIMPLDWNHNPNDGSVPEPAGLRLDACPGKERMMSESPGSVMERQHTPRASGARRCASLESPGFGGPLLKPGVETKPNQLGLGV